MKTINTPQRTLELMGKGVARVNEERYEDVLEDGVYFLSACKLYPRERKA
jgi:hypothetical protein